jgi:formylglycine-generating enzyme
VTALVLLPPATLKKTTSSDTQPIPATETPLGSDEMSAWAKIKSSDKIDELASYLDRFPNSRYSEYVRHRLNALRSHPEITKFRDCTDCPEMVVIPPGSFTMGIPQTEIDRYGFSLGDSAPLHLVRIAQPFALGEFLVTRKQYAAFAAETGHLASGCNALPLDGTSWKFDPALSWRDPGFAQADNHPVVCVSWDDAIAYASWLSKKTGRNYRLPTEAEWEYAARAGDTAGRYFGSAPICEFANVRDQSKKRLYSTGQFSECTGGFPNTSPVGSFPPNGFGLYDMLGNAWEWAEDCWEKSYTDAPVDGAPREKAICETRVRRGGAWNSDHRFLYNVGSRSGSRPYERSEIWGFRVASDYPAPTSVPPQSPAMAQAAPPVASSPAAPEAQRAPAIPTLSPPSSSGYAAEAQDFGVPPQDYLRQGPPHAPTPLVIPGAKTITTADLYARLMAQQPTVLLYVNENELGITGAHWLDGAGRGYSFDDPIQERLGRKLDHLTASNKDAPIVVFCLDPHCWLSYNAALRMVRLGYRNVFWYRGGREAWKAAGLPLTNLARDPW